VDTTLRIVHLLAAIVWVGGTIALVFVAVPPVQRLEGEARAQVLREFGRRWRPIGWSALGLAIVTGAIIASRAGAFDTTPAKFDWVLGIKGALVGPAHRRRVPARLRARPGARAADQGGPPAIAPAGPDGDGPGQSPPDDRDPDPRRPPQRVSA